MIAGITHLPRTPDDLAAWSVYADALLSSADARDRQHGELIARDLALGPRPTRGQCEQLGALAGPLCRDRTVGWCLGFVRELLVDRKRTAQALALVRSPIGRFVETIEIDARAIDDLGWRALFDALPATCDEAIFTEPEARDRAYALLPPHVDATDGTTPDGARGIQWRADDGRAGFAPLPRMPLRVAQRELRVVPVAMQLARTVPTSWALAGHDGALRVLRVPTGGDLLVSDRRGWQAIAHGEAREVAPHVPFVLRLGATRFTCVLQV